MNLKFSTIVFAATLLSGIYAARAQTAPLEDFKPSTLNQPGQEYPQVNSQGYVRFRILAPDAQKVVVSLGLGGTRGGTPLTKTTDSLWTTWKREGCSTLPCARPMSVAIVS